MAVRLFPRTLLSTGRRFSFPELLQTSITKNYSTKQQSKPWKQKPNRKPRLGIILTEDVHNLGIKGQIVKVKRGYGRNYLLPQKKALYATPDNTKKLNAFVVDDKAGSSIINTAAVIKFLKERNVIIERASKDNSAIFEQQISRAFHLSLRLHVPIDCIELEEPIVDFEAEHTVGVRIDEKTVVDVPLIVKRISPTVEENLETDPS